MTGTGNREPQLQVVQGDAQARVVGKDLPNDVKKGERCEPQSLRQRVPLSANGKLGPVTLIVMFDF